MLLISMSQVLLMCVVLTLLSSVSGSVDGIMRRDARYEASESRESDHTFVNLGVPEAMPAGAFGAAPQALPVRSKNDHVISKSRMTRGVKGLMEFKIPQWQHQSNRTTTIHEKLKQGSAYRAATRKNNISSKKKGARRKKKLDSATFSILGESGVDPDIREVHSSEVREKYFHTLPSLSKDHLYVLNNDVKLEEYSSGKMKKKHHMHKVHRNHFDNNNEIPHHHHHHHHHHFEKPVKYSYDDDFRPLKSSTPPESTASSTSSTAFSTVTPERIYDLSSHSRHRLDDPLYKLGVHVTSVHVPRYVARGDNARLECHFNLTIFTLYSLKWYRDDMEFFRYMPSEEPRKVFLPVPGVNVDLQQSTGTTVLLTGVTSDSNGHYKCEVLSDAPEYYTADRSEEMTVVDVPDEKPEIIGMRSQYHIGETAAMTCVSAPSYPAAHLTWFVNSNKVAEEYTLELSPLLVKDSQRQQSRLALQLPVSPEHFHHGKMTLRCSAMISALSMSSAREHTIDGRLTYSVPVMEARDSVYSGEI